LEGPALEMPVYDNEVGLRRLTESMDVTMSGSQRFQPLGISTAGLFGHCGGRLTAGNR